MTTVTEHRRYEVTRSGWTATIYPGSDAIGIFSSGALHHMSIAPGEIENLIAILRVAQDVWTRYGRPPANGAKA